MKAITTNGNDNVSTQTLLLVDSALENKVGVGLNNFPIVYLGDRDAVVPISSAKYIGIEKGDEFSLELELG